MVNHCFDGVKGKLGLGCMRPPMADGKVDTAHFSRMIDAFLAAGFNYFDTAYVYLDGKSGEIMRECLTSRYPRDAYFFVDKLSGSRFEKEEEILPFFHTQLESCGLDYFDLYLMHAQSAKNFAKFKECRAYEIVSELMAQGKIRHMGISFHDKAEVLEEILTECPQIETVQLQFNYLDYDNPTVESRKCYEVCCKFGKPVIVMEPVKGGSLVRLSEDTRSIFDALGGGSPASYAIRFAAGFDNVRMVLSGMSDLDMMEENIGFMKDFKPLNEAELEAVDRVRAALEAQIAVPCTECRYCVEHCPMEIPIPNLFHHLNNKRQFNNPATDGYYRALVAKGPKAGDCIGCGKCEVACPQHLDIRGFLKEVTAEFERE